MKIGIIGPAKPFRGGIAQFLHNMADHLSCAQAGHVPVNKGSVDSSINQCDSDPQRTEVFVFTFVNQYPKLLFPGKIQTENDTRSYSYPIYRTLTPYNPLTWKKTAEFIKKHEIKHLIIKFWIPFFCPAYTYIINYLKKHSKIKIHILCHNIEFHEKWLFSNILTQKMIQNADSLITLSENVFASAKRMMAKASLSSKSVINIFHPLYDTQTAPCKKETFLAFDHLASTAKNTILFLGFIKHYKGLDVFLRAIPLVAEKLPNTRFIMAGEVYGNAQKYHKIIDSYQKQYDIIFDNRFISPEEIPHYFAATDVVVAPYRSATQSGILQLAYSYMKPVIASDIAGLREAIKINKTGLLFENENHVDLAKKIIEFYQLRENTDFQNNICENNRRFTWEIFTEKLLSAL